METLVQFDTAKLAKEKGFNKLCSNLFNAKTKEHYSWDAYTWFNDFKKQQSPFWKLPIVFYRPSQDQLKNWLLKEHFLYVLPIPTETCNWTFKIVDVQCNPQKQIERPPYSNVDTYDYSTFEEAYEKGLLEALNKIQIKEA